MSEDPDLSVLAGEYVLGTLDAVERVAFTARLDGDPDARHAVTAWERRLAPLIDRDEVVSPSAATWVRIAAAVRSAAGATSAFSGELHGGSLQALIVSRNRWRAAALASATLALVALTVVVVGSLRPEAGRNPVLVAAVTRNGEKPALLIRLDFTKRKLSVHPVAPETPSGHSLELWAVNASAAPRSLGLVGAKPSNRLMPAGTGAGTTFAVSVEPEGGSTTGGPSGPVVYAGQPVEE